MTMTTIVHRSRSRSRGTRRSNSRRRRRNRGSSSRTAVAVAVAVAVVVAVACSVILVVAAAAATMVEIVHSNYSSSSSLRSYWCSEKLLPFALPDRSCSNSSRLKTHPKFAAMTQCSYCRCCRRSEFYTRCSEFGALLSRRSGLQDQGC